MGAAVDEYNFRFNLNFGSDDAGLDIGVFAPRDGRVCCGHIDSDTSVIVVPVMADGNLVPGFTVNINNNGQPGDPSHSPVSQKRCLKTAPRLHVICGV